MYPKAKPRSSTSMCSDIAKCQLLCKAPNSSMQSHGQDLVPEMSHAIYANKFTVEMLGKGYVKIFCQPQYCKLIHRWKNMSRQGRLFTTQESKLNFLLPHITEVNSANVANFRKTPSMISGSVFVSCCLGS